MPNFACPRCGSELREADATTWANPHNPNWDRQYQMIVRFSCWSCTWSDEWVIDKVEVEETVKA